MLRLGHIITFISEKKCSNKEKAVSVEWPKVKKEQVIMKG